MIGDVDECGRPAAGSWLEGEAAAGWWGRGSPWHLETLVLWTQPAPSKTTVERSVGKQDILHAYHGSCVGGFSVADAGRGWVTYSSNKPACISFKNDVAAHAEMMRDA